MKLIIEVNTQNIEEMVEAVTLLNTYVVKIGTETTLDAPKEEKSTPSIPSEEKTPEEAPTTEKPKRKRRTKAEIEAEKAKSEETSSITLSDLKEVAQEKARIDRKVVKDAISKYAPKLTEVSEENYAELLETLKAL